MLVCNPLLTWESSETDQHQAKLYKLIEHDLSYKIDAKAKHILTKTRIHNLQT